MADYKIGFKGPYIAAVDFGGKQPTLTIESVKLESIPDDKGGNRDRWVVRFIGQDRAWLPNMTNAILMAAMWGRDTNGWVGKRVSLASEMVQFGREKVEGIRVKGSPDLEKPLDVEVKLARKRPQIVKLNPTGKRAATGPAPVISDDEAAEIRAKDKAEEAKA